ncbi:MAG: redox-regulated ATPase YchF [Deltaproteobacteria bacterium]|nr:redox-regulated ATPase YchF [Deltaproteobacteria bacterium]MBW2071847.1 redox-regulated ATPase YchF [Deltaproteobacteria bacterium]
MRLGIIGLPGSGKTTVFNALTGSSAQVAQFSGGQQGPNLAVVKVPEPRLSLLTDLYHPKKVTEATVEYVDVAGLTGSTDQQQLGDAFLSHIRPVDALVHVVRNFPHPLHGDPEPYADIEKVDLELMLADLLVIEKRLDRIAHDKKRGKKENPQEVQLLLTCKELLEKDVPLRRQADTFADPLLRGYSFLSMKPLLLLFNQPEEQEHLELIDVRDKVQDPVEEIIGKLEMELAQLPAHEAEEFMIEMGVESLARERLIHASFKLLNLISFFTANEQEVRAWTVKRGTAALKAAGVVHSDMERGFIRAEVVSYTDLQAAGSYSEAQKQGRVRLEGKEYEVKDGDVIFFRFHV